jgi:hypothetical protein
MRGYRWSGLFRTSFAGYNDANAFDHFCRGFLSNRPGASRLLPNRRSFRTASALETRFISIRTSLRPVANHNEPAVTPRRNKGELVPDNVEGAEDVSR